MTVSVVIPIYNAARFIGETLDAVLAQTSLANEIIVMDDGSSDGTAAVLRGYGKAITTYQQENLGVARARNRLCALAAGDLIAFLDHDDVWHPRYLEVQRRLYAEHPFAAAFFTGHLDFHEHRSHSWRKADSSVPIEPVLIPAPRFLREYMKHTARFASMSYCCIPKSILARMGPEPFCAEVSGADDFHLFTRLPLIGPVVYAPQELVAYRISAGAQSQDQLKNCRLAVDAFQRLQALYAASGDRDLCRVFEAAFASKCRQHAKVLMGLQRTGDAREQLLRSIDVGRSGISKLKSSLLLTASFLPTSLQPAWLSASRVALDESLTLPKRGNSVPGH